MRVARATATQRFVRTPRFPIANASRRTRLCRTFFRSMPPSAEMLPETDEDESATHLEPELPSVASGVPAASGTRSRVTPPPRKSRSSAEQRAVTAPVSTAPSSAAPSSTAPVSSAPDLAGFFGAQLPLADEASSSVPVKAAPPPPPRPSTARLSSSNQVAVRAASQRPPDLRAPAEFELPEPPPSVHRRQAAPAKPSSHAAPPPKPRSVGPTVDRQTPTSGKAPPKPAHASPASATRRSSIPPP